MSNSNLSNEYLRQAKALLEAKQYDESVLAIRKAIYAEQQNIFAHLTSLEMYYSTDYIYHSAVAGTHSIYAIEQHAKDVAIPNKWLNYTLYGLAQYKCAIDFYKMGDVDAEALFNQGCQNIYTGYNDNPQYFERVFPNLVGIATSINIIQKIKVESQGEIPFKHYSGIKDFKSTVSSAAIAGHIQKHINRYGHFEMYRINDLDTGNVSRFGPLVSIADFPIDSQFGTSSTRLLYSTSKGSLMLQYGENGTVLPHVLQVYESFMRIEAKSFNNYAHTFFIEAKQKDGSTLTLALVDPITHQEGHAAEILNQLDYIKNVLEK